jgi:hypothetical protein
VSVRRARIPDLAPIFSDPHVCSPPSTADLIGRENGLRVPVLAAGAPVEKDGSLLGRRRSSSTHRFALPPQTADLIGREMEVTEEPKHVA